MRVLMATAKDKEDEAIILLGHGSRHPVGRAGFRKFFRFFKKWSGIKTVYAGYLELTRPTLLEAIGKAVARGARRVIISPLFLFPGRHIQQDIPQLLLRAEKKYAGCEIWMGGALSTHPKLLELARLRVAGVKNGSDFSRTALIVVGRGSKEPEAVSATRKFTRDLKKRLPYSSVFCCFAEVAAPDLAKGIARCVKKGMASVVIFPCLLFEGVVMQKIQQQVDKIKKQHPGLLVQRVHCFDSHPLLAEGVWEGIGNAVLHVQGHAVALQQGTTR